MTTNDIDVIDKALLRPGRIDVREEIAYPDQAQAAELFNFWYDTKLDMTERLRIKWSGSPAELIELFKSRKEGDALVELQKANIQADERSVSVPPSGGKKNVDRGRRQEGRSRR
jgi:ATP-dependent Zn protease